MSAPFLVLRALGLGDALTGVPALRGLRRLDGDRPLLIAGPRPVSDWLCRLGVVDEVVPTEDLYGPPPGSRLGRHTAVNLHGCGPQSHRLLQAGGPADLIAFDCAAAGYRSACRWERDEHEVDRWCRLVAHAGGPCSADDLRLEIPGVADGTIVVHPGAASVARQWPLGRWAQVINEMTAEGPVVLTGSEAELCGQLAARTGAEDLSGRLSLDDLAARLASASLLLSGDTGVAHLATALGIRSVTLFGPTPPAWWGPAIDPDLHTVLYRGSRLGDPHADRPDEALLRITVPEVVTAARQQLRSGTSRPSTGDRPAIRSAASS
ncbi:glycosyltransferase family 9 protein [Kribbella sp. NPDC051620]|uniref:glycosyltransferase family 9 protein n=1 Tax=Kribbella sp. NPDC051620 TaxID=3364120 RepID=UPI00379C3F5F